MRTHDLISAFDLAISDRLLLTHPYYRRWQDGQLTIDELGAYAEQYRHFERSLPGVLTTTAASLGDSPSRRLVLDNLRDELTEPRAHAEIFEGFATAVGAKQKADATEATRNLVSLYLSSAASDPVAALSVIGAYEIQAAKVALTKGESLRTHYGIGADGTEFWDIHSTLEESHAAWTIDALAALGADSKSVQKFAAESSDAWWSFLDERNASR
jgi:pyrroloquinoline-quinone synthase